MDFSKLEMCIDIVKIWFGVAYWLISFARHTHIFPFPDDNLSKCQWIFTKLGLTFIL